MEELEHENQVHLMSKKRYSVWRLWMGIDDGLLRQQLYQIPGRRMNPWSNSASILVDSDVRY